MVSDMLHTDGGIMDDLELMCQQHLEELERKRINFDIFMDRIDHHQAIHASTHYCYRCYWVGENLHNGTCPACGEDEYIK
jgi:hypothetical protein